MRGFLGTVPKAVKVWAVILLVVGTAVGLSVAVWALSHDSPGWTGALYPLAAFGMSGFLSTWLLGLGYVYADARRRAMRPALWVLVALFVPHLLGFLLYFVLRQPLASPCTQCAMQVPCGQPYCSWCGRPQVDPLAVTNMEQAR